MARKKRNENQTDSVKQTDSNYYELKTDAIDRLVNAEKKAAEKKAAEQAITGRKNIKKDPAKNYRSGFLNKIPDWIKALFIKFWFNGAVCFFIFWGLGLYVTHMLDMIFVMAVVLGMVTDILVNNAFRFLATVEGQNDKWMMFPKKKFWTFFANIIYALIILIGVMWFYNVINVLFNNMKGTEGKMYIGVEPILFGLSYMAIDMCFIGLKNTMKKVISEAKEKARQ